MFIKAKESLIKTEKKSLFKVRDVSRKNLTIKLSVYHVKI